MRNARRQLSHQREPLPLRQFPFEAEFLLNEPAQIERSRQLLAQELQRRPRVSRDDCPVWLDMQDALAFSSTHDGKFARIESQRRRAFTQSQPGHARIFFLSRDQPNFAELQLFLDSSLDKIHQSCDISLAGFLLNLGHQFLNPVHLQLSRLLQAPAQDPLQRLDNDHQQEQQNRCGGLRRQHRFEPHTHSSHQAQIQQRKKRYGHRINQVLLPPNVQEIEFEHQPQHDCERDNRGDGERSADFRCRACAYFFLEDVKNQH